jgi:hypothetical protein
MLLELLIDIADFALYAFIRAAKKASGDQMIDEPTGPLSDSHQ